MVLSNMSTPLLSPNSDDADAPRSKKAVRQHALDARKGLASRDVSSWSDAILKRLRDLPELSSCATLLTYVSSRDNEVDTLGLITWALDDGRKVLVPVAEGDGTLLWSQLEDVSALAPSTFGILEPEKAGGEIEMPGRESAAIVPGVAFTRDGERIGYGAGYYDRFLNQYKGLKIGLAYEVQLYPHLPREAHDVPVDCVVTEKGVYRRKKA